MLTNATAMTMKDLISSYSESEISELRKSLYASIKEVHGGMTMAADACSCSTHQLRLVLKGVDTDLDVLNNAAEWLRKYRLEQSKKLQSFVEVTKEALSMV